MLEELCSYLGMRYDIIRQVLQPKVLAVVSGGVAVLWLSAGMPGLSYLCFGEEKNSVVQCRKALTEAVARGRKRLPLTIEDYTFGASVAAAEAETDLSGCVVEKLCVVSEEGHPQGRVPLVVCSPASAGVEQVERPAVLMIHATGRGKESVIPHLKELVDMGFVALGMDCRYHGARATDENIRKGYEQAIVRAWQGSGERPFLLDNVWDVQHVIDYACSRGDVDARRIGITGISSGGTISLLAAAIEPRIAALAPMIGTYSMRWALDNGQWQSRAQTLPQVNDVAAEDDGRETVDESVVEEVWDAIVPGLLGDYDLVNSLPAIAPKPLLILNGSEDPICPIGSIGPAVAAARRAYRRLGCADRLEVYVEKGTAHRATPAMHARAKGFLRRHLA